MPNIPGRDEEKLLLEHARSLFQYHAGQRHDSIRNYFIAFAIFLTALVTAHTGKDPAYLGAVKIILDVTMLVLTLVFWALDYRNAQMVEIDEAAMGEIEDHLAEKYGLTKFKMTKTWEKPKQLRRYKYVMGLSFGYFTSLFCFILIHDLVYSTRLAATW